MKMMEKADDRKHFSWCCFMDPPLLPIVVTLIPFAAFFFFLLSSHGFIFSVLITITVLSISSTVLFRKSPKDKARVCLAEVSVQEDDPKPRVSDSASATLESQTQTQPCDALEEEAEMTDLPSDTESSSDTVASEAFELDWVKCNRMACNVSTWLDDDYYDGDGDGGGNDDDGHGDDDDDDDGLIEIALMKDGPKELYDDQKVNKKEHTDLLKLWVEDYGGGEEEIEYVNIEEENLIEIDISIGSIKKPTAEI